MAQIASTPRRRMERAMALSSGKPVSQISGDRHCAYPDCRTRLSRYNPNACCAVHGGWMDEPDRRRAGRSIHPVE